LNELSELWHRRSRGEMIATTGPRRLCSLMDKLTYDRPSEVVAAGGRVLVDGPAELDVAFTPDAALETAERLIRAAAEAAGQTRLID
jgi:hypothetical protein